MQPIFNTEDLQLIQGLTYSSELKPNYESLKGCLVWDDESPDDITSDGLSKLGCLWGARALLHRGLTLADHPLDPTYCRDIWERALQQIPEWPGFKRLSLSDEDRKYYEDRLSREEQF